MPLFSRSLVALPLIITLSGCGAPPEQASTEADLAQSRLVVHGTIQPQTFLHDAVTDRLPQIAWSFSGHAGDVVAPDVWPTGTSALKPTLTLLGPAPAGGKRPVLATGTPRGQDDAHLAIDGFHLPKTGSYLVLVGQAAAGQGGQFTLRFWSNASHAPRIETAQLDLALRTSPSMMGRIGLHEAGGAQSAAPWADADVDGALSEILGEPDMLVAMSDTEQLLLALQQARAAKLATDDQLLHARQTAAALVGRPAAFAAAPAQQQAFALFWLGRLSKLVFDVRDVPSAEVARLSGITSQIGALVASWPRSIEDTGQRAVHELSLGGAVYGYSADWTAEQVDADGTKVFSWFSTDYFDAGGSWLGEQSTGASEPDDD